MYRIEPLGPQHDRGAFCCGNGLIDAFCTEHALKDHEKGKVRVFVACPDATNEVVGFYSLCLSTLEPKTILNIGYGKRPIPAIYLAMVGVTKTHARKGLGTALMTDAFARTLQIVENAGAYCLWLDAVDEPTAEFYAGLDFRRITEGQLRMYIAVQTIRDALSPQVA